jgi:acetyl esterase/lipase
MTKKAVLLIGLLCLCAVAGALILPKVQVLQALRSLYSTIVTERGLKVETGVRYGPLPRQVLDVYHPAGASDGPIAIYIYGGGWIQGDRAGNGFVGAALAARGITTVVADYRLYPQVQFPGFVEDAARAYAWTSANLATSSSKSRPIFVLGHSAGAHIAALLALDPRHLAAAGVGPKDRPAGLVGLAGPYAFDPTTHPSTKDIFAPAMGTQDGRPVSFAKAGAPPALLMHGLQDQIVDISNMRTLAEALGTSGVRVRALELEGMGHGELVIAISRPWRWRAPVLAEIEAFIRATASEVSSSIAKRNE